LSLGAKHCGGIAQDKLLYQTAWNQANSHIEDFLFNHRSNGPSRWLAEIIFCYQTLDYSGLVPSASAVGSLGPGEQLSICQLLNINRDNLSSGTLKPTFEMVFT
jgi:hypothetical protein